MENGEVHQAHGEKSPPEASEDTSVRTLSQDSKDSKPLQGMAPEVEGPPFPLTGMALKLW
jgi:hypothetical protein